MNALLPRDDEVEPFPRNPAAPARVTSGGLPPHVEAALWRGNGLGSLVISAISSGWPDLDRELPGGGWPCHSLTEVLSPQSSTLEWRLLGPALRRVVAAGGQVVVVGAPKHPHLPGLRHEGIDERHLVWIRAETPSERLWATEQLVKANAAGVLVSWLPQARPEQLRRLQVCTQACDGPVVLFRPAAAQFEASPAPLRLQASFGLDWELNVHVLKRRGPLHEGTVALPSIPGGLATVLTPRLRKPSRLISKREDAADVVGSPTTSQRPRRHATAH